MGEGAAEARLSAVVWPPYIGLGKGGEIWLPVQQRAQIQWRPMCKEHGIEPHCLCLDPRKATFAGKAMCWVPKGEYTKFMFFHSPDGPQTAMKPLSLPYIQLLDSYVPIDPIINEDPLEAKMDGIPR